MCHYCHNPGHVLQNCRKLQHKNQRFQSVHHHKSLQSTSISISTLVESGKTNTCFIYSSSTWVINSGAIDHITGNSSLFITFQLHPSTSTVTLADESTSCIFGSGTIHPTPLITLTSVMSLPQFSFNFISMSKLARTLNCSITFFPDHYLFQDRSTQRITSQGRKSRGLYILESKVTKFVVYSGVVTQFDLHCSLDHSSLRLLKKLYPQFSSLSPLNYESCQYDKLH